MGKYFGTDGVRGRANDSLTPELAYALGRAAAMVFSREQTKGKPLLVIGRDTRISGPMLEAAIAAGITATGCDVLLLGVLPTPGVAVLTRQLNAAAGVMISASHNPYYDNGIKFFAAGGRKLPDEVEEKIEALLDAPESIPRCCDSELGLIGSYQGAALDYLDWLHQQLHPDLSGCKLVVDAANGASAPLAQAVFSRLGAEVVMLADQPDGVNINHDCGSTHLDCLRQRVVAEGADIGLALDGDADRLLAVDETGAVVDGDRILAVLAEYLLAQGRLTNSCAVVTQMSNLGFRQAMRRLGVTVEETRVGDRYVLERMQETGAVLGGEQSGHIILGHYNTTGDGLLAALLLLTVLTEQGRPLSELITVMQPLPQVVLNVRVRDKRGLDTDAAIAAAREAAESRLAGRGRILLRPSGTEPLIRVMAEGGDEEELRRITEDLAAVISDRLG